MPISDPNNPQVLPTATVTARTGVSPKASTSVQKANVGSTQIKGPAGTFTAPAQARSIPPPEPIGIEKFVLKAAQKLGDLENKIDDIFDKYVEKPLKVINEVDICNIVNYALSKIQFDKVFKNHPELKLKLDNVKAKAAVLSEAVGNFTTFTSIGNAPRDLKALSGNVQTNLDRIQEREKILNLLKEIKAMGAEEFAAFPTAVTSLVPGMGKIRTSVEDAIAFFGKYNSIENIPSSDIQKLVNKIHDLQAILGAVASLGSAQGLVNLLGLQKQIQQLQKVIDPARLIPSVKKILQVVRNINQAGLQILKILSIVSTILKILNTIVKVCRIIVALFHFLALPNLFNVHGGTALLETIKAAIQDKNSKVIRLISQINRLVALMYEFTSFLLSKTDIISRELQILLLNLQACEQIKNSALVDELQTTLTDLNNTADSLRAFRDSYFSTQIESKNTLKVSGFTIKVIEEEVVDEGKKLKRRRAVAFNDRGLLVLQGELTFATDVRVLIEELRLKLQQKGYLTNTDTSVTIDDQFALNTAIDTFGLGDQADMAIPEEASNAADIKGELNDFILGLKNGRRLKKKVKEQVSKQIQETKQQIQTEKGQPATTGPAPAIVAEDSKSTISKKLLTESQRKNLKRIELLAVTGNPLAIAAAVKARKRLKADDELRKKLENN